jgi:hypothetical protein
VRNTRPNMSTLMDRVAERLDVTAVVLKATHDIRNFRNNIVHQNPRALIFDYSDCAKSLGSYLGFLPQNW